MRTKKPSTRAAKLKALRQAEARLRCIIDYDLTGISFADLNGNITEANDVFLKIIGCTRDDLATGKLNWRELTAPELRHLDEQAIEQVREHGHCSPFEKECISKDGNRVSVLFGASLSESKTEFVCFVLDLSEYKQAQEKVNYVAYHDSLTDLPNQALFKDRLDQALAISRRNEQVLAVMLVNLDRFKTINETLGYVTADQVLREVSTRLVGCVRKSDTVARFGSDDFALLLTQVTRAEDAAKIAHHIKDALAQPITLADQELFVTASAGISFYPYDAKESVTLLKAAGTALNRAKEHGGDSYELYTAGRTTRALKQLVLENNMRPGLEREEFIIYYQPQVNTKSFQLVGMEALVRWQHPVLGLLYPGEFIHLAEESGQIVPIGEWTLRIACTQCKSWQNAGFDPLRVAVNISARQFQQSGLVETISQVLSETGMDPHLLELELTEGSIMKDPDQAIIKLHELKTMGVHISIDDFGTGYSSLNYLKRFPIDTLKIDRSFVKDITTDTDNAVIVNAIITLAHALKLNVIAEGVETKEQLEYLRRLDCDEVQGFLFSAALSVEEFTQLLDERRGIRSEGKYVTNALPETVTRESIAGT
ncbi:MAG TPA: EAL domain-containing protein [Pyrinomonadaceae bacterium]|nr:EAL domain-containing protein [Pyrinomonadaceae bacterium]